MDKRIIGMDLHEDIKLLVDNYFEFEFNTKEVPISRTEFISILEQQIEKLIEKNNNASSEKKVDHKPVIPKRD